MAGVGPLVCSSWFGTGNQYMQNFLPFAEALAVAQSLGLASHKEWLVWGTNKMRPPNMPADPAKVNTHDGWKGWGNWLGSRNHRTCPSSSCLSTRRCS